MKQIIIFVTMLTASLSNAFTQSSAIQCCLKGADKGTSAIVSYVSGNNLVPTDTVALDKKGNFKTQVNVSEPTLFIINFFGIERNTMHVMLEPKENVTLEMEYIPSLQFIHITEAKGSDNAIVYKKFNDIIYHNAVAAATIDSIKNATGNQEIFNQQMQQLQINQNIAISKMLEENKNTLMSAFLVTYFDNDIETYFELFKTVDHALIDKYSDNQFVKYIDSKVKSHIGPGIMAPEIAMKDPDGVERKLSDLRGKVVMIDFWASWCRPCRMENPNVVKLYKRYHDKGFEIYSVSLDKDRRQWLLAIEQDGLEWPNHVSDLKGWTSSGGATYGIMSVPSTVLVDREGRIIARNLRGAELANKLKEIFGE